MGEASRQEELKLGEKAAAWAVCHSIPTLPTPHLSRSLIRTKLFPEFENHSVESPRVGIKDPLPEKLRSSLVRNVGGK